MSYNGTVRCGHCFKKGHNRRSCPTIKAEIAKNPDGVYARHADRKAKSYKTRSCSYCHDTGHNKRTCPKIATDRRDVAKKNRDWRAKFIEIATDVGLAPGALVQAVRPQNEYAAKRYDEYVSKFGSLAMVLGFNAEELNHTLSQDRYRYRLHHVLVLQPGSRKTLIQLTNEFSDITLLTQERGSGMEWQVVCPSDNDPQDCFNADFLDGSFGVDRELGLQG